MKSVLLSILWYFKARALRESLNQGNSLEKYRGKHGEVKLSVFNVDAVKYLCQKLLIFFSRLFMSRSAQLFWPYLVSFERCFVKLTFDTWNLKKKPAHSFRIWSQRCQIFCIKKFFRLTLFILYFSSKTQ